MRHWMTGFGTGLLVVLTCLSVQAQNVEQRIEKLESSMSNITDALPSWVQRFTFEGDLRLRYQYEDTTGEEARNRGRLRYRLGVAAKVTEQIKAVFGLASGGDDPRSTNQTFQDTFSSKGVRLDLAYAEYQPFKDINRRFAHFPPNLLKSLDPGFAKLSTGPLQPIDLKRLRKMTEPRVLSC